MNTSSTLKFSPSTILPLVSGRRRFLSAGGSWAALASLGLLSSNKLFSQTTAQKYLSSTDKETDIIYMSSTKLAQLIREKKLSSSEVTAAYIKRIESVNPKINAIVATCFERAIAEAKALDEMQARGQVKGALHGVPMTIKDSFDTEGVVSTGGTVGRMDYVPKTDATVVARARAAGAILLGKSNTPEFTLGGGTIAGISTTSNIIYGLSRNPYNLERSTAGSSGGAGAIVAAGGAAFDIGSDWGGSIRGPANFNGIAGIKPTYGSLPRTGHIVDFGGMWDSWQEVGPMARKVEDLLLITPLLWGPDGRDCAMAPVPYGDPASVELSKLKVAFYTTNGVADPTPEIQETVRKAAKYFAELGCEVTEDFPTELMAELEDARFKIARADGWTFLERLAKKHGSKAISATIAQRIQDTPKATSPEVTELLFKQDLSRAKMRRWFQKYDLILCPGNSTLPTEINRGTDTGPTGPGTSYTGVYNTLGWPGTVVRAGTAEGLPIGIQIIGKPWQDHVTLVAAQFIESKTGGFVRPAI